MSRLTVSKILSEEDRDLPIFTEFEKIVERIRDRAFRLSGARGYVGEHALDDWLTAERQICWPPSRMTEIHDAYEISVALAGFDKDEIDVTATDREIIIKAAHETAEIDEDEMTVTHFSEFCGNHVFRRFELPADIRVEEVTASFDNGLLTIDAPKAVETEEHPVPVEISTAA